MPLNDQQRRFVDEYTLDCVATQAAIRAGYSERSAYSTGHRLLQNPEIAAAIQQRQDEIADRLGLTAERLLRDQYRVYTEAMRGVIRHDVKGDVLRGRNPDTGDMEDVYEPNFAAANKAVETLMKHRGMFTERVEHSGSVVYTLDVGQELGAGPAEEEDDQDGDG